MLLNATACTWAHKLRQAGVAPYTVATFPLSLEGNKGPTLFLRREDAPAGGRMDLVKQVT